MKVSLLLNDKDFKSLKAHLDGMRERTITRTLDGLTVTATLEMTDSTVWNVPMCVTVIAQRGEYKVLQHFPSAEAAWRGIRTWDM